jgi:hypothetical protein
MNNVVENKDVGMKEIQKWHKLSQFLAACIYITVIPFLIVFLLHFSQPTFSWCNLCLDALMYGSIAMFVLRIFSALIVKFKVWHWENQYHQKLSDKELIQLL